MTCNHNCDQGRRCNCTRELPVTMEDNPFDIDRTFELVRDFFAALGFVGMLALIGFFFGYRS